MGDWLVGAPWGLPAAQVGIGEAVGELAGLVYIGEGESFGLLCFLAFWARAQSPSTSLISS